MKKRKRQFFLAALMSILPFLFAKAQRNDHWGDAFRKGFEVPPDSVKPSVYWYWMMGNISEDGVRKDLKAMAEVGIGRVFIGNIGYKGYFSKEVPQGQVKMFSDEWWKITKLAISEAGRYGLEIGLFNGPGWSQSGGPWIKPNQSMRYLKGVEINVTGPKKISLPLPEVPENFQDVAVLAFPAPAFEGNEISSYKPTVKSVPVFNDADHLVDGDVSSGTNLNEIYSPDSSISIDIETEKEFIARSLLIYPGDKSFSANGELLVYAASKWVTVRKFNLNRMGLQFNVGFDTLAPIVVSFQTMRGKKYRLVLKQINGTPEIREIKLSASAVLEQYPEKQLAKMFPGPLPLWDEYQWQSQPEPDLESSVVKLDKIHDLTGEIRNGRLEWNAPEGEWVVIRYGMMSTGVSNSPSPAEGQGLEVDKINGAAIGHHFNSYVGRIQDSLDSRGRQALKWVVADSYETGSQNWTDGMSDDFNKVFGYDPLKYLPVLSGRIVGSVDQSDRFLWDLRRYVADKVAEEYVGGLRKVSNQNGLKLWLENYGHWGFPSEFLSYGKHADELSGEFWTEGSLGGIECRAASSAAHIYGKTKVSAESFTSLAQPYSSHPAVLKKRGDWSFTEGVNNTLLHVYIHQPDDKKLPGLNAWFGTEFNRHNTWFYQGKTFFDYLRRCNFVLQQGKPVNDIAYFIGEDAPKMTGILHPALPQGYSYDFINADVIINSMKVIAGRLVLPDGMSYRLLILPPLKTMRPELLKKIIELVNDGATVLGSPPSHTPGLQNYPDADMEVKKMATQLWGNPNNRILKIRKVGNGLMLRDMELNEVMKLISLSPDVSMENSDVLYAHRKTKNEEIYFLTNQSEKQIEFSPGFRVLNSQPQLWDPVTGGIRILPEFSMDKKQTFVPIKLQPLESAFIVFPDKFEKKQQNSGKNYPSPAQEIKVEGDWMVSFDSTRGGPADPVHFKTLSDWSTMANEKIKYYAGTAIYNKEIEINTEIKKGRLILQLGDVGVMAKVKINDEYAGSVWTKPFTLDVTDKIKKGKNKLEIEVVNTWANRLIGDSKLPVKERATSANYNNYNIENKLTNSGLIGPVLFQHVIY